MPRRRASGSNARPPGGGSPRSAEAQGQFASEADTLAGQTERPNAEWKDLAGHRRHGAAPSPHSDGAHHPPRETRRVAVPHAPGCVELTVEVVGRDEDQRPRHVLIHSVSVSETDSAEDQYFAEFEYETAAHLLDSNKLLYQRFVEALSLPEIGERIGFSAMEASRRIKAALVAAETAL